MYPIEKVSKTSQTILLDLGVKEEIASEVTACLAETSLRGVDSHGMNLMAHYIRAVKSGRINPKPNMKFKRTASTTGIVDADDSFGHAAASLGIKEAIKMAREHGCGFVAVGNSTHFSACSYYSLQAAREGMIGFAVTHTDAIMLSSRGKRPYIGTNPISFTFPCEGEDPICLDMATTQVTFNSVRLAAQKGVPLRPGLAVDSEANIVTDASKAVALMPMGDYKGYALGFVVEVLCSLMTGMPFGRHISSMFKGPIEAKRKLAHFVGAIDISRFVPLSEFTNRMKQLVTELRNEPAANPDLPVLVPGDPEKKAEVKRRKEGIPLADQTVAAINAYIRERRLPSSLILSVHKEAVLTHG